MADTALTLSVNSAGASRSAVHGWVASLDHGWEPEASSTALVAGP